VKCRTQNRCSASAGGGSFLHPAIWQEVPMGTMVLNDRLHPRRGKSSAHRAGSANVT
jgi:hypothetical protein